MISVVRATQGDVPAWRALAQLVGDVDDLAWLARLDDAIDEGRAWQAVDLHGAVVGGMLVSEADDDVLEVIWLAGDTADLRTHAELLAAPRSVRVVAQGA